MTDKRLPRSTPEEQGVPSGAIISFLDRLKEQGQEHHSFMLLRHGHVIAEGSWFPYSLDDYHMMFSFSKSIASTAIGLAVQEGLLTVEDRITDIFKDELTDGYDKGYDEIKVKHLLTMTTGQKECVVFSFFGNYKGDTLVKRFFNIPLVHKPGTKFMYNTGASYMLSAIIQKLTGQKMIDYMMPRFFEPMGIDKPFSQESAEGIAAGGWGMYLRVEDMAKFGQLYLNKGVFNGKQILSADWVKEATSKHTDSEGAGSDSFVGYGYQIWLGQHGTFRGEGAFYQMSIVMPEQDAVLAATNGLHDVNRYVNTFYNYLMPYLNSSERLPEDPENYNKLKEKLKSLKYDPLSGQDTSPCGEKLFGKVFTAEKNKYDFQELLLECLEDNSIRFVLKDSRDMYSVIAEPGKWHKGESNFKQSIGWPLSIGALEPPDYKPQPVFASYAWTDNHELKLCIRYAEAPTADYWTITVNDDNSISVLRNLSAAMEFAKREPVIFTIK